MTTHAEQRARLKAIVATYLSLVALLAETEGDTYRMGQAPRPREDTTERGKGTVSDPTPAIVADRRRQQLRNAWGSAEAALVSACEDLDEVARELTRAHDRWLGAPDPADAAAA
ncbi:DUF7169 domain-containing protein [Protaetiibacter mangrovi]|uniref:Uncharacterized protein n=1 Tax=Protaetiibacter mangrovi TaxID=2970926 RepID=A0ABT1ZIB6_9MICO|nr:hypothetical protein [Protaetiibacter mangrovi]MCS0500459.1 hypothetical protein [Protaetiibacter mangrovi]TPX04467.1 hypothetical protein FJ656_11715 [Schumannella luteola]